MMVSDGGDLQGLTDYLSAETIFGGYFPMKPTQWFFERLEAVAQRSLGKGYSRALDREVGDNLTFLPSDAVGAVVDVGGNAGDWSAALLRQAAPQTLVIVEPSAANAAALKQRFADKPFVSVVQAALSDQNGEATLFADDPKSALASLRQRDLRHVGLTHPASETVKTMTLQTLCVERGIDRISILKIDVEGHELAVLQGAVDMLPKVDVIQFEFGGASIDTRIFFRDFWYLLSPTHRIFRMSPFGLMEIIRYSERLETAIQSNFVCARR